LLFARNRRPGFWERTRMAVLPRTGLRRAMRYRMQRIARMGGSPHYLAGGVALGVALALTPWFGLHFVMAVVLARILRVSAPLALAFTLLNNPWTLPIVMIADYELGRLILGDSVMGLPPLDALSWNYLLNEGEALLLPLMAGSTPLAVLGYFGVYWPLRRKVARMQQDRRARLDARRTAALALEPGRMVV
jgi:uncharacterized protein (DUF2062 family)